MTGWGEGKSVWRGGGVKGSVCVCDAAPCGHFLEQQLEKLCRRALSILRTNGSEVKNS